MKRFRIFLGKIIKSIFEDKLTVYAAQVSFFIVISVVAHGKCSIVNIITFIAVNMFHPFCFRISPISIVLSIFVNVFVFK